MVRELARLSLETRVFSSESTQASPLIPHLFGHQRSQTAMDAA